MKKIMFCRILKFNKKLTFLLIGVLVLVFKLAYSSNGLYSVTDTFENEAKIASKTNLVVDTVAGQVKLVNVCAGVPNNTQVPGCNGLCQACQSGFCGIANAGTDPGSQCTTSGCTISDNCSGTGATCEVAVAAAAGSQQTGCTGCYYCNGAGGCVLCTWTWYHQWGTSQLSWYSGGYRYCNYFNQGTIGYDTTAGTCARVYDEVIGGGYSTVVEYHCVCR